MARIYLIHAMHGNCALRRMAIPPRLLLSFDMTSRIPLSNEDRDLNKKVALALGWRELKALKIQNRNSLLLEGISPREEKATITGFRSKQYVPNFAGDMNAALELLEDLRGRGYHGAALSRLPKRDKFPEWECFLEDPMGRRVAECAETPARAVCLALLNVLGAAPEESGAKRAHGGGSDRESRAN